MVAKGAKRKALCENEIVMEKCSELARAITAADDLPRDVVSMLIDLLPQSLGQPKDKRHRFQEQAIQSVDRIMQGIERKLGGCVEDARSKLTEAQQMAEPFEVAVVEAEEKLRRDSESFDRETKTLSESALAFRAARTSEDEMKKAQATGDEDYKSASKKRADLQAIIDGFVEPLKNGTTSETEVEKQCHQLLAVLKQFGEIDDAMMMVLGSSLAKAPAVRGNFDVMAIEQLDKCMAKRIEPLDEVLRAGENGKQERANAVKTAQAGLEDALQAQKQQAEIFEAAWNAKKEDETALQKAKEAVKDLAAQTKRCDKTLYNAEAESEAFLEFSRKSFEELKERNSPPEVVEPESGITIEAEAAQLDTGVVLPEAVAVAVA
jgi:hypothetical protein